MRVNAEKESRPRLQSKLRSLVTSLRGRGGGVRELDLGRVIELDYSLICKILNVFEDKYTHVSL